MNALTFGIDLSDKKHSEWWVVAESFSAYIGGRRAREVNEFVETKVEKSDRVMFGFSFLPMDNVYKMMVAANGVNARKYCNEVMAGITAIIMDNKDPSDLPFVAL